MESTPITVGIIDDDCLYSQIITMILERAGMKVLFQAPDGKAGIAEIEALLYKPRIVIVDIEMPVMDGFETMSFLHQTWPHLRIIAHSSLTDISSQQQTISCGAQVFILKHSPVDCLIETIQAVAKDTPE